MNENVAAAVFRLNEAEALCRIEPFNCSDRHLFLQAAQRRVVRTMSCRLKFDFNDDLGNGTSYGAVNKADRLLEYNRAMQLMWIYKSLPDFRGGIVDGTEPSQKVVRLDIPVFDESAREDGTFARDDFAYDPEIGIYLCPAGKVLTSTRTLVNDGAMLLYRASKRDCDICELKPRCCQKMAARKVPRSIHLRRG
jgi:hypothetical protein